MADRAREMTEADRRLAGRLLDLAALWCLSPRSSHWAGSEARMRELARDLALVADDGVIALRGAVEGVLGMAPAKEDPHLLAARLRLVVADALSRRLGVGS